tara:strand:- start:310 stop:1245 length:936 start_codon:yes stop_codon:yes gene_type:complete
VKKNINKSSKIYIAGHTGLVGSAILSGLKRQGYKNLITAKRDKLNLLDQKLVLNFFKKNKPDMVFLAAAKVGGIAANNKFKAQFIYENLQIQNNIIHSAHLTKVKNLIFLGSSCIYPKKINIPIKESYLLKGELEKTNEPYAIAKIAGIKMCESYNFQYNTNYKCLMPCNIYGPNDNYDSFTSHFLPALIKKAYFAKKRNKKEIYLWGTGKPKRELLFVDDLADACIHFMNKNTKETLINIGYGKEKKIIDYLKIILKVFKINPKIKFDKKKPDGVYSKLISSKIARSYGWYPKIDLKKGLKLTIESFKKI